VLWESTSDSRLAQSAVDYFSWHQMLLNDIGSVSASGRPPDPMLSMHHMHTTMAGRLAVCTSCYPPWSVEMNVTSSLSLSSESSCPLQHQNVNTISAKAHHHHVLQDGHTAPHTSEQ
jgi:hypothetical protein